MQSWIKGNNYAQSQFIGERLNQEDSVDISLFESDDACLLAVLSDGMGGHEAGEIASQVAVKTFRTTFQSFNAKSFEGRLYAAMQASNAEIARSIAERAQLKGMGCTLVGLVVSDDGLSWASVGDSPLYLFRDRHLIRLNEDHSMLPVLEKLLSEGKISREELAHHPQRNSLRSAVTGDRLDLIDTSSEPYRLLNNDVVICASDGLLTLSESEISSLLTSLRGRTAADICDSFIAAVKAKARPRQDNLSVQVLIVSSSRHKDSRGWGKVAFGALLLATLLIAMAIWLAGGRFSFSQPPQKQKDGTGLITPISVEPLESPKAPQRDEESTPRPELKPPDKKASPGGKSGEEGDSPLARKKPGSEGGQRFEPQKREEVKAPKSNSTSEKSSAPSAAPAGVEVDKQGGKEKPPPPTPQSVSPSPSGVAVPSPSLTGGTLPASPTEGLETRTDGSLGRDPDLTKGQK